ncbi:hypothetical protein [Bordetella pertussis]|uniref:hypothetical protein n=1 Tax=Bordetella pertussis TaxID=520 RepID=UPI00138AED4D|nr:hypothetical protein [Bordetella pertussis]
MHGSSEPDLRNWKSAAARAHLARAGGAGAAPGGGAPCGRGRLSGAVRERGYLVQFGY